MVRNGKYQHYEGNMYILINTAIDARSHTQVAIYKNLMDGPLMIRKLDDFLNTFRYMGDEYANK